jgi:hypothetical protein
MIPNLVSNVLCQYWIGESINSSRFTSLSRYIQRVLDRAKLSNSVVFISLYYIYKISQAMPERKAIGSEIRLFVAAILLADSFLNDNCYSVSTWSTFTSFSNSSIVKMKSESLKILKYQLALPMPFHIWVGRIFNREYPIHPLYPMMPASIKTY